MKGLLKNLGLILILLGGIGMIACQFTGNVNNNAVLGGLFFLMVVGLVVYIVINKRLADWIFPTCVKVASSKRRAALLTSRPSYFHASSSEASFGSGIMSL